MRRNTPEKALRAVRRFLDLASRTLRIEEAYLFGSYARGTWLKTSDIDLVIVSSDFKRLPYLKRLDMLYEIQWKAGIRPFIEVIPLTPEELERKLRESAAIRDAAKYWVKIV